MEVRLALAGNPNCGKTTLFNALTGDDQYVGNWPGVTVEKKEGRLRQNKEVTVVDIPGIYSLSPYSPEEIVARDVLLRERTDVILNVVDAADLERHLYLTTQLSELGKPLVVVLNRMDVVQRRGDSVDADRLARLLRCPVVPISALNRTGLEKAVDIALDTAKTRQIPPFCRFDKRMETALCEIDTLIKGQFPKEMRRFYTVKLFERDPKVRRGCETSVWKQIDRLISAVETETGDDAESLIAAGRYDEVTAIAARCCKRRQNAGASLSDKIDRVLTHRFFALPIFAAVMFSVYWLSVTSVGGFLTDWLTDGVFGEGFWLFGAWIPSIPTALTAALDAAATPAWLGSLLIDGIIAGVGSVLSFVPQLVILFFLLSVLESCGYMARVAFLLDRLFARFGLSGKSFIPMLIGTGCSVPGILSSRTIENDRDRRITIITTSFVPCSAKLPVIALIASALFDGAWWVAPSAYFAGIAAVLLSGLLLKKQRLFAGEGTPFVMELPDYHRPRCGDLLRSVSQRVRAFVRKAGTIILLASVVIWAGSSFGWVDGTFAFDLELAAEDSLLGVIGSWLCPLFAPLGFGGIKECVATVMGLVAKEEIVGVFGVLDFQGMAPLAGYSFLLFNLLCVPCFAAVGAIRREMNSAKWTAFAVCYQCLFAYAVSLMIYQFGLLLCGTPQPLGLCAACAVLVGWLWLLLRPAKERRG